MALIPRLEQRREKMQPHRRSEVAEASSKEVKEKWLTKERKANTTSMMKGLAKAVDESLNIKWLIRPKE